MMYDKGVWYINKEENIRSITGCLQCIPASNWLHGKWLPCSYTSVTGGKPRLVEFFLLPREQVFSVRVLINNSRTCLKFDVFFDRYERW